MNTIMVTYEVNDGGMASRTLITCGGLSWRIGREIAPRTYQTTNPGEYVGSIFFFLVALGETSELTLAQRLDHLYQKHPELKGSEV